MILVFEKRVTKLGASRVYFVKEGKLLPVSWGYVHTLINSKTPLVIRQKFV